VPLLIDGVEKVVPPMAGAPSCRSSHGREAASRSGTPMIIFVIEINGKSILAFDADSQLEAEHEAMSPQIGSDLMVYETADGPIWNGQDEIVVREARPDERAPWLSIRAHSREPVGEERHTLQVYLVEIVNEADGAARQKPLN
jgi:hypothetical protein